MLFYLMSVSETILVVRSRKVGKKGYHPSSAPSLPPSIIHVFIHKIAVLAQPSNLHPDQRYYKCSSNLGAIGQQTSRFVTSAPHLKHLRLLPQHIHNPMPLIRSNLPRHRIHTRHIPGPQPRILPPVYPNQRLFIVFSPRFFKR
jgi:hypothetical protein